jgi:Tfp pilus assembly protein PilV
MSPRVLIAILALAVLLLALAGWLVQAVRWPARAALA